MRRIDPAVLLIVAVTLALSACARNTVDANWTPPMTGGILIVHGTVSPVPDIAPVLHAPGLSPMPPRPSATHRLRGFDARGDTIFDIRIAENRFVLADSSGRVPKERRFIATIDVAGLDLDHLFRVEIETADGQRAERRQTMDRAEAARAAATPGTIAARAMADGTVQFQWDAERFPFAHVADDESGQALRSGYTGELVLRTDSRRLAVTLSEGVHTVRRTVRVQSRR